MIFKINNKRFFYLILFFITVFISFISSLRDFSIGKDTLNYIEHFYSIVDNAGNYKFEPLFNYFAYFIGLIHTNARFFLFFVTFIITAFYLHFFFKVINNLNIGFKSYFIYLIIFLTFLLLSSWYFVAFANGIRQGLSLSVLYVSLYYLVYERRFFVFLLLYTIAVLFHFSTLLLFPFIFLLFLNFGFVLFGWLILGLFYSLGLNQTIVMYVSDVSNIDIYSTIKYYSFSEDGAGSERFEGFIIQFFLYTIFWPLTLLFLLIFRVRLATGQDINILKNVLLIYFFLTFPYFVFGFGPFSNRLAFIGWFFIPILQFFIIYSLRLKLNSLLIVISYMAFNFSVVYFIAYRLDFKFW